MYHFFFILRDSVSSSRESVLQLFYDWKLTRNARVIASFGFPITSPADFDNRDDSAAKSLEAFDN